VSVSHEPEAPLAPRLLHGEVSRGSRIPELSYDVTATTVVLGAMASRDWRPMHHDRDFAVNRNGTRDIFLNTPTQAAWFERYLTDWTGPHGRLGRMSFRMSGSVFPGDTMVFSGVVEDAFVDEVGCGWVEASVSLSVERDVKTSCAARIALPRDNSDNPWARRGELWRPEGGGVGEHARP
jgi:acyl dehydratase